MKRLQLRPYPGEVWITKSVKQYQKAHLKRFGEEDSVMNDGAVRSGRMMGIQDEKGTTYIVYATSPVYLAHELSHVVLDLFECIGIDPRSGNGEPFCYLLSQLMLEATE